MELANAVRQIDAGTARAFVSAARHFIDALLIEGQRVQSTATPVGHDYETGQRLSRETPAGVWISNEELRGAMQRMAESLAAEKWVEGALFAVRAVALLA